MAERLEPRADLPVRSDGFAGRDDTTFRLGARNSVRVPGAEDCVFQVDDEKQPPLALAPELPIPGAARPRRERTGAARTVVRVSLDRP
jgi:hypothetical protein